MSLVTVNTRWGARAGTAADLAAVNEVPMLQEPCFETDTLRAKLGDGVTAYNSLPYASTGEIDFTGISDGDVLTWDAANSRFVLTAPTVGVGSGAWVEIDTYTVSGAAATTMPLDLSAVDMSPYRALVIFVNVKNATVSSVNVSLFFEGDTTAGNYDRQVLSANSATVSASRANDAFVFTVAASSLCCGRFDVQSDVDSDLRTTFIGNEGVTSSIILRTGAHTYRSGVAITDIDTITLLSSVASAFAVNSNFIVYGVI